MPQLSFPNDLNICHFPATFEKNLTKESPTQILELSSANKLSSPSKRKSSDVWYKETRLVEGRSRRKLAPDACAAHKMVSFRKGDHLWCKPLSGQKCGKISSIYSQMLSRCLPLPLLSLLPSLPNLSFCADSLNYPLPLHLSAPKAALYIPWF